MKIFADDQYIDIGQRGSSGGGGMNTTGDRDDLITEPTFEYKSEPMNLKYNKFFPFIGAYLVYKFLWRK
jgi:hypothetical protein